LALSATLHCLTAGAIGKVTSKIIGTALGWSEWATVALAVVSRGTRRTTPAELVRDGDPIYAWPFEQRRVWRSPQMPFAARVLERAPGRGPVASLGVGAARRHSLPGSGVTLG
jgi:hypothetical protein